MTSARFGRRQGGDLVPVGYRFPLVRSILEPPAESAAGSGPEPFGLRFFRPAVAEDALPSFRYSRELQVAMTADGATPLIASSSAPEKTTTGNGGSPRGEEFRIDFAGDYEP